MPDPERMETNISNHLQVTRLRYYKNGLAHLHKQYTPVKVALGAEKILETFCLSPFCFISLTVRECAKDLLIHGLISFN